MTLMVWEDKYLTNVSAPDEQHKEIFRLVNVLDEAVDQGKEAIEKAADELVAYVVDHFATEEKYMQETNYPNYEEHKKMHDNLVSTVGDIVNKFKAGEGEITHDTTAFVRDWLYNHIPNVDKEYGPYFNEKGIE